MPRKQSPTESLNASARPQITLLTDFGRQDTYVGILKGVIARICPQATVVDLTHEVPPQDVRAGAYHLLAAAPYFPPGTIHLAVVDPGVGSQRRLLAVAAGSQRFVGPDNGLLRWAVERLAPDHWQAVTLTESRYWLRSVSRTFHGRDIMAPVAAHLAAGAPLVQFGPPASALAGTPLPRPSVRQDQTVAGELLHIDHFGNAITSIRPDDLALIPGSLSLEIGGHTVSGPMESYAAVAPGKPLLIWGSAGFLEVAVRDGSAARDLHLGPGDPLTVRPLTS